ncbi:MAG TPA: hypothetical protein VD706_01840 [Candidatus Saccharimonadales bacterium]|nr:hypothetical protein [Candidatus Saccharimonadales bacterium]
MANSTFEVDKENLEVRITRVFDATPERLWEAFTDASQIPKWWLTRALTPTTSK